MKRFAGIAILALATTFGVGTSVAAAQTTQQQKQSIKNGPILEYVSDHDAVVAFTSTEPADMTVKLGTDPKNLNQSGDAVEGMGGTNHRIKLDPLQPDTTYYIQVATKPAAQAISYIYSFKTLPKGTAANRQNVDLTKNGPVSTAGVSTSSQAQMPQSDNAATGNVQITNGPVIEYVSDHSAVIAFTSKGGADMTVKLGTDPNNLNQSGDAVENGRGTNHRIKLEPLQPSTTYYFQLATKPNATAVGQVYSFQTVAKGAAPKKDNVNLGVKK